MIIGVFAAIALAGQPSDEWSQVDALINYNRHGASLFMQEWHCFTNRELAVRAEVEREIEKYTNREQAEMLRRDFEQRLDLYAYGNQFLERKCDRAYLARARASMPIQRRYIDEPALASVPESKTPR